MELMYGSWNATQKCHDLCVQEAMHLSAMQRTLTEHIIPKTQSGRWKNEHRFLPTHLLTATSSVYVFSNFQQKQTISYY